MIGAQGRRTKGRWTAHDPFRRAFTYLELVMVMIILAIVAVAAKPRVVEVVQREKLRRAAHKLRLDMKLLQGEALRLGTPTALGIDAAREFHALWWYRASSSKWRFLNTYEPEIPAVFCLGYEPDYRVAIETVSDGSKFIEFDRYGLPAKDLTITLSLGTLRVDVKVTAASGVIESGDIYDAGVWKGNQATGWPTKSDAKGTAPGSTDE
ncbi:MAG: hypothetical protein BroJett003_08450 [Planctomycetota bacterium]|nr:MAG: hypothetical protein BroJett003_08450 [Planctomycetota bacterium]